MDAYLGEIAKGYGIAWSPPGAETDDADDESGDGGVKVCVVVSLSDSPCVRNVHFRLQEANKSTALEAPIPDASAISAEARKAGVRTPKLPEAPPTTDTKEASPKEATKPAAQEDDFDALAKRFAALKKR